MQWHRGRALENPSRRRRHGRGAANDDDFTPELCDEELKATAGNAVLLYWQYDDGGVTNLAQAVGLDLSPVLAAYDYVVLVADNETSNPMNAKATIFGGANMTFPPTRAGLLDAFRDLTSKGFRFDTFVSSSRTDTRWTRTTRASRCWRVRIRSPASG